MKKLFVKLMVSLGILVPAYAYAASPFLKPIKDLLGDLEIFIQFLNWALPALGILVFFMMIIVFIAMKMHFPLFGLKLDETKAGRQVFWAMVGLACMFAVYGIIQLLGALVGVDTNRAKTITAPSLPQVGGIRGSQFYGQ
jgi:hypothetical protein